MANPLDAASATLGLAWRVALTLACVAALLGISSGRDPGPPGGAARAGLGGALARDEDGTLRLTLGSPGGKDGAHCVIRDAAGVELMRLHYSPAGSITFDLAASPTVRMAGHRGAGGEYGLGIGGEGRRLRYDGRPGSPPVVYLYGRDPRRPDRYRVTSDDGLIHETEATAE